jgi:hypothetical protein
MVGILGPVFSGRSQDINAAADSIADAMHQARTRAMTKNTYVYVGLVATDGATPEFALAIVESGNGLASPSNTLVPADLRLIQRASYIRGVNLNTDTAVGNLPGDDVPSGAVNLETSNITFPSSLVSSREDLAADFTRVLQFSPDGAVRLDATRRTVPPYILLGLIPATGEPVNSVGILVDGTTGAVRVVRPGA